MSDLEESIVFWPDPMTEAVVNARPSTKLFGEFMAFALRNPLDEADAFFSAADIGTVLAELDVDTYDLSEAVGLAPPFVLALAHGWHRPNLRSLCVLANALDVPISTFIVDADGDQRLLVRRYRAYRRLVPPRAKSGD